MSATMIERLMSIGDYENDGGSIDTGDFVRQIVLFEAGLMTQAQIATRFSLTVGQTTQLAALLGTLPTMLETVSDPMSHSRWTNVISSVLSLAAQTDSRFDTEAEVKTALGMP